MRELVLSLRTTWKQANTGAAQEQSGGLFPLTLLSQAKRGFLLSVGTQMNGCFDSDWYDTSAVMMRRLVEISIIEAFEHKGIAQKIKAADDNYLQLSDLVSIALNEPALSLSRNAKKFLPQLRDAGHMPAHGRFFHAQKEDLDKAQIGFRVVVEELLRRAALLWRASGPNISGDGKSMPSMNRKRKSSETLVRVADIKIAGFYTNRE
jgi:hypothetical protein